MVKMNFICIMNLSYIEICIIVFEKCIDNEIFLKYENLFVVIDILNREKFLRLTMGFGYFMYSHSLVPVIDL